MAIIKIKKGTVHLIIIIEKLKYFKNVQKAKQTRLPEKVPHRKWKEGKEIKEKEKDAANYRP